MPPTLTDSDRVAARERALAARRTRAELKAYLRSGRIDGEDVLRLAFADSDRGRAAARMTIGELLLSIPGIGPVKADRLLVAAGVSGDRRLRALGARQQDILRRVWR